MTVIEQLLTTRGTEIDQTATVPMPVFVRYFEHLRWLVMRDPRLGLVDLIDEGCFFVVRTQIVELRRRIGQGTPLAMRTYFEAVGRSTGTVRHEAIRISDGAVVARARVVGVWLGPNRRIARLPDQFRAFSEAYIAAFPAPPAEGSAPAGDAQRVVRHGTFATSFTNPHEVVFPPIGLADEPPSLQDPAIVAQRFEHVHRIVVPRRDLDVFSHVNAATWALYCDDARHAATGIDPAQAATGWVVRAGLFYAREAVEGDALDLGVWTIGPRALGFACMRAGDPSPLVTVRYDLAPGARPITSPGTPPVTEARA